ncbi:MAG: type II toxin-antitoxin system HicA family toxin [Leptospiraceae bacterium]|nr:type II toxin-antitoxin system HicA family toxin [Leptospiraceae bacterium]MCK6379628.1 type II toxin-antitoxin system HicA family toxin [Leptospiraceae bacterium]NUM41598.1 type II toxin-antitoxin system HicA family toxin [Leptospiraceae bacterium]
MGSYEKIWQKIIDGNSDANIDFEDICKLLQKIGFEMRVKGSHHIFRMDGVEERINVQKDGAKAKPYQVRQIRKVLILNKLKEKL